MRLPPGEVLIRTFRTDAAVRRKVLQRGALNLGLVGGMAALLLVLAALDPRTFSTGALTWLVMVAFPVAFAVLLVVLFAGLWVRSSPVELFVTDRRVIGVGRQGPTRIVSMSYARIGDVRTPPGLFTFDGGPLRYWRPGEVRDVGSFRSPGGYQFVSIVPRGSPPFRLRMQGFPRSRYPPVLPGEIRIPWMRADDAEELRRVIALRTERTRVLPEQAERVDTPPFEIAPASWRT